MDSVLEQLEPDKPGGNSKARHKWREWHEREVPVKILGSVNDRGLVVSISSKELNSTMELQYPNSIWTKYKKRNKVKLLDNVTYIFTAHLPFLLKGNIRLEYNTGYPQSYSWASQCFLRFLPAYWYLQRGRRGTGVFPLLKTMLNSRAYFSPTKDVPPVFPETLQKNVVIPFTFGKDSFLTYCVAKEMGLDTTLVYFNEPTELFAKEHKLKLISLFGEKYKEKIYFMDNPLGNLREFGEGWFGWELALTSWTLLALPFNYAHKAAYIVFSNEKSVNEFFYDDEGLKVIPDYEQSAQAIEELSILTQSLSEGEVYTTTFLQGLNDLGIIAILKHRYAEQTLPYLMSCWAEDENSKDKRWCGTCSKCARLYVYMTANGIDPEKESGFEDNMLTEDKAHLYNVFGAHASGTGWDAFGLNTEEQALAFYLSYMRGRRDPLILKFRNSELFNHIQQHFSEMINNYFWIHEEESTPPQWRESVSKIYKESLKEILKELNRLNKTANFSML